MKRIFLIYVNLCFALNGWGQSSKTLVGYPTIFSEYEDYFDEWILTHERFQTTDWAKKKWWMYYHFADNTYKKEKLYIALGDSILGDKSYARIILGEKTLLYRQEGDKVYIRDNGEDKLLIDYSLKEGDSFIDPQGIKYIVTATTSPKHYDYDYWIYQCVQIRGKDTPKILYLKTEDGAQEDEWIEGLGSAYWGILPPYMAKSQGVYPSSPVKSHVIMALAPIYYPSRNYLWANYELNETDFKHINLNLYVNDGDDDNHRNLEPWTFNFIDDTLCITTDERTLNIKPTFAECSIDNNIVKVSIGQMYEGFEDCDCIFEGVLDIRIPGFAPGTYQVDISGHEKVTLECKDPADGVNVVKPGATGTDKRTFDLSGRPVPSKPQRGLYIQGGRIKARE